MSESTELQIIATPPSIEFDYEGIKAELARRLEQYDVVVTEDSLADAKKMATELNKQAEEINRRRIDKIREISAPIKDAEDKLKELAGMCKDGRQRILDQVQVFEQKRLDLARNLLTDERDAWWNSLEVEDEFRKAQIDDLVKLGSITQSGKLAKAAKDDVRARAEADKAVQDRTERRLLELENRSYKAGLSAPLLRGNVEHILFEDDEAYEAGLERIFESEKQRQEQIEARQRADQEREARIAEQAAASAPAPKPEREPPPETPEPAAAPGKRAWTVIATFRVEVKESLGEADLKRAFRNLMEKANASNSLQTIFAVPEAE